MKKSKRHITNDNCYAALSGGQLPITLCAIRLNRFKQALSYLDKEKNTLYYKIYRNFD